jgi:rsbT co-antagonist protein RsbR
VTSETSAAHRVGGILANQQDSILKRWVDLSAAQLRGRASRNELEQDLRGLAESISSGLAAGDSLDASSDAFDGTRSLLTELSHARARQGFSPTETTVVVFALKDAVLTHLDETDVAAYRDFFAFSTLVDKFGLFAFETFTRAREQIINDQAEQLLELSTPVVKLWEGIVAIPLVGTLDSARTQVVMEKLLQTLVDTGSEHAIIDITGVAAVDTQVAQHLLKTVMAARLMGAECIISGIRPQIAQTIVALGIEFGDIRTKATLADALVTALRASGSGSAKMFAGRDS